MERFPIILVLSALLQLCYSYHNLHVQLRPSPFKRQLSKRQTSGNFFSRGFNWDDTNRINNFNNNRRWGNFNNDGVFFPDDSNDGPWDSWRPWNNGPGGRRDNNVNPTISPLRTSTVAVPGMGTTRSPCEDACRITSEYNPVCGTNGITYNNERWLKCAQNCGRSVSVSYFGRCPLNG